MQSISLLSKNYIKTGITQEVHFMDIHIPMSNWCRSPKRQPLIPPYTISLGLLLSESEVATQVCDSLGDGVMPNVEGISHCRLLLVRISITYRSFKYL